MIWNGMDWILVNIFVPWLELTAIFVFQLYYLMMLAVEIVVGLSVEMSQRRIFFLFCF